MKQEQVITVKLDTIDAYNKLFGLETRHPLVSVIDLKKATCKVDRVRMDYGVYALFLKNGTNCILKYGRQPYDYQEGSIVSFAPGQVIDVDASNEELAPDVVGLMFHPDLLYGTPLAIKIKDYRFFEYSQREALHLSEEERSLFLECLNNISHETEHPVDKHSAGIIASHIQLLLDYMARFYERQFITRHKVNSNVVARFEKGLKEYYASGKGNDGIPSVNYFA
ncbi:MAG: AraC family transcriptional regulator, partial [Muribaculaceae bacterium]|nr:AraC family transcriptional regulator [Muribaculaceae bacterium]